MKYSLTHSNGHFIATIGNKYFILDTGSPESVSFGSEREVEIEGKVFPLKNAFSSAKGEISALTGISVEGLIGMDALTALGGMEINKEEGYVEFGRIVSEGRDSFPLHPILGGYLSLDIAVNGMKICVLLDTGARIDYFDPSLLKGEAVIRGESDYNPILGYFSTDGYETVYSLGEREMKTIAYGATDILENYVSTLRRVTGISGVAGINAFFLISPTVTFDFSQNLLILEK